MTPLQALEALAALVAIGAALANVLYTRGKLDGHARASAARLDEVKTKLDSLEGARVGQARIEGADSERAKIIESAMILARSNRELIVAIDQRQRSHEDGCDKRQISMERQVDHLGGQIENMGAQIRNLATGLANRADEVSATPPRRAPR